MRLIFSLKVRVQTMDFGRQRGFLLDGEDPPEKVGCRKESYFVEIMNVDVARDFLEQFSMSFLIVPRAPITTGTFVVLSPQIHLLLSCIIYCFESNLNNNAVRKKEKYLNLINEMSRNYRCVRFVNLSMTSLGVFSDECSTFLEMMDDIGIDKKQQRYIIKKMINIAFTLLLLPGLHLQHFLKNPC